MSENLFKNVGDLVKDFEENPVQEMESLCMECEKTGTTRMLLTMIPYFKEVVVMSFRCEHCGNSNSEIQSASEIQERGSLHTVHVTSPADLDRQIVKSEHAVVSFLEYELSVPEGRGQLTTIEGIIRDTIRDLSMNQPLRKVLDVDVYNKINHLLSRLRGAVGASSDEVLPELVDGPTTTLEDKNRAEESHETLPFTAFTLQVRDPAGNSFVSFKESPNDPKWSYRAFNRTHEENVALRLANEDEKPQENVKQVAGFGDSDEITADEVFQFPGICSSCAKDSPTNMKKVNIPYFQDILIMSTNCEHCGFKDNEVKAGGAISEKGKRITLKVEDEEDLSRDILKSEHAGLNIPEINLVLEPGTLGGRFTTLEGLLQQVYEDLSTKAFIGDSAIATQAGDSGLVGNAQMQEFEKFLTQLKSVITAAQPFTVIIDDPLASSYVQNFNAPDPDEQIIIEEYERTHEQNDDLGLTDGNILREDNDFGLSTSVVTHESPIYTDNHGRLSKWSADNKARFLSDLDKGKAGDWIIALGNEAADTDSLASSIAMAYHLEHTHGGSNAIALLLTPRDSLDLRPENQMALENAKMSHQNHQDLLTIDELPMKVKRLAPLLKGIVLVDHPKPVGDWKLANISGIIDHHKDRHWGLDANPRIIEMTKSCSSLVARELFSHMELYKKDQEIPKELADLLLAAIALDSSGLETATDVDIRSAAQLYKYTHGDKKFKGKKFFKYMSKLSKAYRDARNDLDKLDFLDLLKRDYKGDLFQPENHEQHRLHLGFASIPFSIGEQINRSLPNKTLAEYRAIERQFMVDRKSDINVILSKHKVKNENGEKVKIRDISVLVRHDGRLNGTDMAQTAFDNIVEAIEGNLQVQRWNGSDGGDDGGEPYGRRRIWKQIGSEGPVSMGRVDPAGTVNTADDVSDTADKDDLTEVEEASESSTIGDQGDHDDRETINGDKQAGDSDSTFRSIQLDEDILNAITTDDHDDDDDQTSLKHTTSIGDLKSVHDTQSIASTTDQSFVSAKESLETASSAISFHSTASNVQFPSEDGHRKESITSSSLHSHTSDDELEAKNAANALPAFNVDSNDAHNSVDQDDIADISADTSPANTTVDSIFDNTHVSFNDSPSTEFNSVVSTVSPKVPPARKRNISAQSETPTIRASSAKNLPPVPPKRERRRVASTPTTNVDESTKRQSNEAIPDRPSSRLILPSEFIKLRNGSASSSVMSESTKYPKSTATSTSIRPSSSMTSRPRSWTVSGVVQSRRTSQVMKPTTFIDQMLPSNALGLERTMLSVSVTSGAADKLAKSSNRSVFSSKSNKRWQKRRSLSWSAGRSNRNYTTMQFSKPMITLGLSSHSKPPEKLDPHFVLIRVHSTALDNFDALTLMRGTGINNFALEEPPGPEYGFIPGRMARMGVEFVIHGKVRLPQ
ncbi:hypothetical protein E3Q23_03230 [Wallemia mellicola]|uniref:Zf-ZPR1-domain-containing protein n=1 Tax=Wallemia mellicola TaxID=1708541 RepID=A0A4T0U5D5_9BASI|nr:hypothetical protein E3Q23_03230 [Wallemia mellicola]TIC26239.1 zf-ZPR1-domain-containing protein [Wallemia mellicola]TIC28343.1 zf-ZPR1-domain-containing protein [Wallemia mellicola]TIC73208.1 zf-ZPR1-domain-containing protein [Wallemia mellicola]